MHPALRQKLIDLVGIVQDCHCLTAEAIAELEEARPPGWEEDVKKLGDLLEHLHGFATKPMDLLMQDIRHLLKDLPW